MTEDEIIEIPLDEFSTEDVLYILSECGRVLLDREVPLIDMITAIIETQQIH